MPSSTSASLTPYRPAVIFLAISAAVCFAYLYRSVQTPASHGLHRSNAVRRPRPLTELADDDDDDGTVDDGIDEDGQTLQRTLFHIAEDRARNEGVVHRGITCNGCDMKPIRGDRWHCATCSDVDLCSSCEATSSHVKTHIFYKIRVPAPYLHINRQEPLYPGKPHLMPATVDLTLKKRLVAETHMEPEEIEALWEHFTCLAGTEWLEDTNKIGWALDRRAFNHGFIPRYNGFLAAPNLIYDRIFAFYDSDNNGLIGFEEWIKGLNGMHSANAHVRASIAFRGYDVDQDGYVSRKDILRIFRAYYAIEKEATRNYVADVTEDLSVRTAMDTIRSSQPLGSAFRPHGMAAHHGDVRLRGKPLDDSENSLPVLRDDQSHMAEREDMLRDSGLINVRTQGPPHVEEDRIVRDRWTRRQFYTDEEEGLQRPEGVQDDTALGSDARAADQEQTADPERDASQTDTRPRLSRSSSRVRFQDDVDVETRSNASSSSRPLGERWGGYEIPEAEKDLGKEVLYQITQQGFNQLLDPLFKGREDNAIFAHATRSERRNRVTSIERATEKFKSHTPAIRVIYKLGIFRYTQCFVDLFCKVINNGTAFRTISGGIVYDHFKETFETTSGTGVDQDTAVRRILDIIGFVDHALMTTVEAEEVQMDDMSLWNTWLCLQLVWHEILWAIITCAHRSGWIHRPEPHQASGAQRTSVNTAWTGHDPTMPQFRPNSTVDMGTASTNEPSAPAIEPRGKEGEVHQSRSSLVSRYLAYGLSDVEGANLAREESQKETAEPAVDNAPPLSAMSNDQAADEAATPSSPPPDQSTADVRTSTPNSDEFSVKHVIDWSQYKNSPAIHALYISSENGVNVLHSLSRPAIDSSHNLDPDADLAKVLIRSLRQDAMSPKNALHDTLLASLDVAQQEINDRKGSGLINFHEFAEFMKDSRFRFLDSWMTWVSI
jgi:Ca2+-binding EF-hand superfamily protein